jgi:hypothetical protein
LPIYYLFAGSIKTVRIFRKLDLVGTDRGTILLHLLKEKLMRMRYHSRDEKIKITGREWSSDFVLNGIILLLPFLIFFWTLPFVSGITIGNDYPRFSIHEQIQLMFSIKTGSFPLYVPGYAGGQSASALTLGQLFHPISHLTSLLPGYWSGKALEWNTLFRLLTLGVAHLLLFNLLKKFKINILWAFVLSFITVYNLRMLDLFRYGASLESWTGYLFLCSAIGFYHLKPSQWKGPVFIVGATYWLICSGHPQMMYYALLGAGLFTLVIPFFTQAMIAQWDPDARSIYRFWFRVAIFGAVGLLLSSAYTLPFYFDFILGNAHRVAQDYAWADMYRDTFMGTVNNFFQPLRSDVTGVFGGSSLILIAALLPLLRLFRVKVPFVIWGIWGVLVVAFLHMQGGRTPVHFLVWKFLPLASSFRVAGRISLIMPVFFMLILTWLANAEAIRLKILNRQFGVFPQTLLAVAALTFIGGYFLIPDSIVQNTTIYSAASIREIPHRVECVTIFCGTVSLLIAAIHGYLKKLRDTNLLLLFLFACAQIILLLQYGTWIEEKKDTPQLSRIYADMRESLDYRLATGAFMENSTVIRQVKQSFLEPLLGRTYNRYRLAADNEEAYALMHQDRAPDEIIVEHDSSTPEPISRPPGHLKLPGRVRLTYSSFNRLVFEVRVSDPGFFGLAYPFTGRWKASVNTKPVRTYRGNGAYHAVAIPEGISQVDFRYWSPAAFWGIIISCSTFLMIGIFVSCRALKYPASMLTMIGLLVVVAAGFMLWYRSLYNGEDLQARYIWTESPASRAPNYAYGKRTMMSSFIFPNFIYYKSSGRAVDGIRTPVSGFVSGLQTRPWWVVDLHQLKSFSEIAIYEGIHKPKFNLRPLIVAISNEGKTWRTVKTLTDENHDNPLRILFNEPQKARYVMIQASGTCYLSLDEVEIYPARKDIL